MKKLLTVAESAHELGLKPGTIRAWIAQRRIGVVRLGRAVRIPVQEIERLIVEGTMPAKDLKRALAKRVPPRGGGGA